MARMSRRSRPDLEGLEGRRLLNGHLDHHREATRAVAVPGRVISYETPGGAHVRASVIGKGFLTGTTVDADGGLNLVFSGTNAASKIQVDVRGGTAPLRSVHPASLPIGNLSGVGGQLLGALLGPKLNLVPGGKINLTSGIGRLQLNAVGPNTQVNLRDLPPTIQNAVASGGGLNLVGTSTGNGSVNITGASTTNSSTSASTTPVLLPGESTIAPQTIASNFAPATNTAAGRTLTYSNDPNGGSTLTSVSGLFVPTGNLVASPVPIPPAKPPAPPGVVVQVSQIDAGTQGQVPLGNGQIFGYDPVANVLIRFDEVTGTALQAIPVGGAASTVAGVGLGRNGNEEVVLLGRGTTVQAFDVVTGAPVGAFTTSPAGTVSGSGTVSGIALSNTTTVLTSANSQAVPGSTEFGVARALDVTASLASGQAVPIGLPFNSTRAFEFAGGAAGVPGSSNIYVLGAAHFDTFQPLLNQLGVLTINPSLQPPRELSRTVLTNNGASINAGPPGTARANPDQALGSVENLLARVSGVSNGQNIVYLYAPSSLAPQGTINLADPNRLAALSGTVHPELLGSALFDVQGNIQSFAGKEAHGLALNDSGNLNLVKFTTMSDSTIVGQPVSHIDIRNRQNVAIVTPARSVGTRGDVTINPNLRPLGPLSLPG